MTDKEQEEKGERERSETERQRKQACHLHVVAAGKVQVDHLRNTEISTTE
jgi:hypothetical protein